jgi:hypothetical protein
MAYRLEKTARYGGLYPVKIGVLVHNEHYRTPTVLLDSLTTIPSDTNTILLAIFDSFCTRNVQPQDVVCCGIS